MVDTAPKLGVTHHRPVNLRCMPTVVLVHGAWHSASCWSAVTPLLGDAGVEHVAVDLPFSGHDDDITALRDVLDQLDGRKILVGHSYGGLVISGAGAARTDLDHLLYLCAFMVEQGSTVFDALTQVPDLSESKLLDAIVTHGDGTSSIDPDKAFAAFYHLCRPAAVEPSVGLLRPMDASSTLAPCQGAPWTTVASTYVICAQDQAIPVQGQRFMAANATSSVVFDTDHSPFLSMPTETVALIVDLATASA